MSKVSRDYNMLRLFLVLILTKISLQTKAEMSETEIMDRLKELHGSDRTMLNVPVELNGSPLDVTLQFTVVHVRNVNEITSAFLVDLLLYFTWYDLKICSPSVKTLKPPYTIGIGNFLLVI